jgi:hypothetical protein
VEVAWEVLVLAKVKLMSQRTMVVLVLVFQLKAVVGLGKTELEMDEEREKVT